MRQKPLFLPTLGWRRYKTPGGYRTSDAWYSFDRIGGAARKGPMRFCVTCGRAANNEMCCGHETINIGFHGRAPRTTASRKQWKRFCKFFGISFESLKFV